jgi:hypothetical protein
MPRKWFQFRLRTLLVAVIVCALPLAWYAALARHSQNEQQAIRALVKLSDRSMLSSFDDEGVCMSGVTGSIERCWQGPAWIPRRVNGQRMELFYRVERGWLGSEQYDDRVVEHLVKFTSLKQLTLHHTSVSPEGVRRLRSELPHAKIDYLPPEPFEEALLRAVHLRASAF